MNLFFKIKRSYKGFINRIAVLPAIIAFGIMLLAFVLMLIGQTWLKADAFSYLKFIRLDEPTTARSLLSSLLTGTISLTVFSFAMVMVVVNQSAANYSPKVIEGFITRKINRVILGVYIGTILFIIISLAGISDRQKVSSVPHLNILASIILMAVCIGLFIIFIQNISDGVRINNVAERIFLITRDIMKKNAEESSEEERIQEEEWHAYKADNSGYFQNISNQKLLKILVKEDLMLKVIPHYGTYILNENTLFALNKKIVDEELLKDIRGTFNIYSGEDVSENYFYGFRQLREVAVKGLSPGLNDPGIAIICLDYLSELLVIYLHHGDKLDLKDEKGKVRVHYNWHTFAEMMHLTLTPIITYGKSDHLVLCHVLKALDNISIYDKEKEQVHNVIPYLETILETANKNLELKPERNFVNDVAVALYKRDYFKAFSPDKTPLKENA